MEIGFSQPIELPWMEASVKGIVEGLSPKEIRCKLDELLSHKIAADSSSKRSSRNKRVSILMKIWVEPRKEYVGYRNYAMSLWSHAESSQRVLIHYAMTIVAYPFVWAVSIHIGRLLRIQDQFSTEQLKRRCQEEFGQRDTVAYALTRVVRTLTDWGLLIRSEKSGTYQAPPANHNSPLELEHLLIEAYLRTSNEHDCLIDNIAATPGFFPWQFRHFTLSAITSSSRLSIYSSDFGGVRVALSRECRP